MTLAYEDTNSIPTDNANRAIQDNVAMQSCNLVTNFRSNASGATSCPNFEPIIGNHWQCKLWWPNLQLMQVAPSGGQILQLIQMVVKFATNASGTIWWTNLQQMFNMLTLSQNC